MPENVNEETVSNVYMEAWKNPGCKGITVYIGREWLSWGGVNYLNFEKRKKIKIDKPKFTCKAFPRARPRMCLRYLFIK